MTLFETGRFLLCAMLLILGAGLGALRSQTLPPKVPDAKVDPKREPDKSNRPTFDELWNAYPKDGDKIVISDDSDSFSMRWLRNDYRVADAVAFVDVVEVKLLDRTEGTDCDNNRGVGYCAYLLTAEVKEVYKGEIRPGKFEFVGTSEAFYPKKGFMGEQVVFLLWGEEAESAKPKYMVTLENSSRHIDHNVINKMRNVVNPLSRVDDEDESEPYSKISIRKSYLDASAVAYVEATAFRPDRDATIDGVIMTATVKKVFKGNLKPGQTIEYRQNLIHRKHRKEDLGPQVIYLSIPNDNRFKRWKVDKVTGKESFEEDIIEKGVIYVNEQYTEAFIKHGILEKLSEISKKTSRSK